jgi:hypothetical protein
MKWQLLAGEALKDQNAIRLLESTQVEEIVVLVENVGDIVAHVVRRAGEQHYCLICPSLPLCFLVYQRH